MRRQLAKFFANLSELGITGRVAATIVVASSRQTIWPTYLWLSAHLTTSGWPLAYVWVGAAIYFAFWVWIVVLLTKEGKRYRGMALDALCGGALITVAAALNDPPVRQSLSEIGFGAAAWVVFLGGAALVLARSVQQGQPSTGEVPKPDMSG